VLSTDLIDTPCACAHVIEAGQEFQIAPVGRRQQFGECEQAVDRLLDGVQLPRGAAVPVYHLAVVLEEGYVIRDRLQAQDPAEFVVHLDRGLTHVVLDPGALDARVRIGTQLPCIASVHFPAQKRGHVLGLDRVDGSAHQGIVDRGQVGPASEHDVRGVLGLLETPVIAGRERLEHGTAGRRTCRCDRRQQRAGPDPQDTAAGRADSS
jgi:hypothetical protein